MASKTCYAIADTPRAVLAVLALLTPFAAINAAMIILGTKGYEPLDYFRLLAAGTCLGFHKGLAGLGSASG